jgi:hypothetical protein
MENEINVNVDVDIKKDENWKRVDDKLNLIIDALIEITEFLKKVKE